MTTTTITPYNPSTIVPVYHSTTVDPEPITTTTTTIVAPALLPTTTTFPDNLPTSVAPAPDQMINTTLPSNPPHHVLPEPDTTITTCIYANPRTQNSLVPDTNPPPQNAPVPDMNPPPTPVAPIPDTSSPTTSTPTVVDDFHVVKWYDYEGVIDLDASPSIQWKFTNQFGDPFYHNDGVWMSRLYSRLIIYGLKTFAYLFDNTKLEMLRLGRIPFNDMAKALRLQVVVRFATRFEFSKQDELWITVGSKYMPAIEFGKTGMGRDIFKNILSAQRYSK